MNTKTSDNVRKCYDCKCLGSYEGGEELALLFGEFLGDVLDNTGEAELAGHLLKTAQKTGDHSLCEAKKLYKVPKRSQMCDEERRVGNGPASWYEA